MSRLTGTILGGLLGGLIAVSGYMATDSMWSWGFTFPIALVVGFIIGNNFTKD